MSTTDTTTTTTAPTFAKGSWQEALQRSSTMLDRSTKARKLASNLLWKGAVEGINEWIANSADTDANGEGLYGTLLDALGTSRKGDASKIKTVALAVKDNGLDLAAHPNLAKAYGEAVRLTKGAKAEAAEDDAAEKAIESIEAPKTASTQESAAALLLSKGVDGAVVAILDALGASNFEAHRSFLRSVSNEINHRVQAARDSEAAKKKAEAAAKKAEADKARAEKEKERAAAKKAAAKKGTKPTAKKATAKPATTKAKPVPSEPVVEDESVEDEAVVETPAPKTKAKRVPVRRAAR
jgi:hypothetical protein